MTIHSLPAPAAPVCRTLLPKHKTARMNQHGVKEGRTAVAFRFPINFGFVPAVWIKQENTTMLVTFQHSGKISQAVNSWKLFCTQRTSGKELVKIDTLNGMTHRHLKAKHFRVWSWAKQWLREGTH